MCACVYVQCMHKCEYVCGEGGCIEQSGMSRGDGKGEANGGLMICTHHRFGNK